MPDLAVRTCAGQEARARLAELAAILQDAVAGGASVNFLAGLTVEQASAYWSAQLPGLEAGTTLLVVAERPAGAAGPALFVGTVLVFLAQQPNAPHRAEIGKMLVLAAWRRHGLGRRLLEAAERQALAAGRTLLILDTEAGSPAETFYRHCGWLEVGRVPDHSFTTKNRLAPTVIFYKALAPHPRTPPGRP